MHRGHDHHYDDGGGTTVRTEAAGAGHNRSLQPRPSAQWQTPHRGHGEHDHGHDPVRLTLISLKQPSSRAFLLRAIPRVSCVWRGCRLRPHARTEPSLHFCGLKLMPSPMWAR